ncbi:MAG: hypothetical protein HN341_16985 [Verrucomicrobia bacterium]|jgi:hypothetical protein|nr:hypothetical protein [Verrucomicrobiota bacterium]
MSAQSTDDHRSAAVNLFRRAGQAWFGLTRRERLAILIVVGILLLGTVTRWWFARGV